MAKMPTITVNVSGLNDALLDVLKEFIDGAKTLDMALHHVGDDEGILAAHRKLLEAVAHGNDILAHKQDYIKVGE